MASPYREASESAVRALDPVGRASEPAGLASEPAGWASGSARRASDPVGRAYKQAMRASEEAAALRGPRIKLGELKIPPFHRTLSPTGAAAQKSTLALDGRVRTKTKVLDIRHRHER